ncbi:MAG TPA: amidohydrolase family protein [Terrimicrobiaceae bacterium]|nr:amidohydrolase family protein [Terrimicrobiaceae bacterium]
MTANFQPYWRCEDVWLENNTLPYIGPERARHLYQIKTLADRGARLALGSDWPISSPNPFLGMMVAATHKNPKKPQYPVWEPEERMPIETLLEAYTLGGAWINHSDEDTGSLEQGKAADFTIIDRDILAIPLEKVGATQVLSTYVDGKCVFRRASDSATKPSSSRRRIAATAPGSQKS